MRRRARHTHRATATSGLLLLLTMFLPRVRAQSNEDFFNEYYGAPGPLGLETPPSVNAWFFSVPALGTLVLVLAALALALTALLRPDLHARCTGTCTLVAALLLGWTVLTTVWYPAAGGPPFDRLLGTWIALAAATATAGGLALGAWLEEHRPPVIPEHLRTPWKH